MNDTGGTWSGEQRAREHEVIDVFVTARSAGDRDTELRARDELVLMHSGFVQHIAHKEFAQHVDEDIIQAGMVGLIEAIDRFDPGYGNELTTYAVHRIRAAMRAHRDSDSWSVHAPRHLRQLNARIRTLETAHTGSPLTVSELAQHFDVEIHEVMDAKSLDHLRFADSLDAGPLLDDGEEDSSIAQIEARETVRALLACLEPREREIVTGMMLEEKIQREVAESLGISQSQVSRIQRSAMERMRTEYGG